MTAHMLWSKKHFQECILNVQFIFREEPFYDIQLNVKGKKDSKYCNQDLEGVLRDLRIHPKTERELGKPNGIQLGFLNNILTVTHDPLKLYSSA